LTGIESYVRHSAKEAKPYFPISKSLTPTRKDVIRMHANENPLGPSPKVVQAIIDTAAIVNRYPDPSYLELRQRIAKYVSLKPENVLVGGGSDEAIDMLIKTFVNPGDEAIISVPTFEVYEKILKLAEGRPVFIPMQKKFYWDIEGIKHAISQRTKLIFICSPNNPTGSAITENDAEELALTGKLLVIDEAYAEFSARTLIPLVQKYENVIILRTFSKFLGLAGLRVGYILACPEIINYLDRVRLPFNVSLLAERAAITALDDIQYAIKARALVRKWKRYLYSELAKIRKIRAFPSEANFILIDVTASRHSSTEIVNALSKLGILVRDCAGAKGLEGEYIRVSIGLKEENERFIKALKTILKA
jgi:histidinol-phosphate aminotransferase